MDWDFLVSCAAADRAWGEWIAWALGERGGRVRLESRDALPGSNRVHRLDEAVRLSARTVAVVSPAYLSDVGVAAEWHAAWRADPFGLRRTLVPVRVAPCEPDGLLRDIAYVDLVGLDRDEARARLAEEVGSTRRRAPRRPLFP